MDITPLLCYLRIPHYFARYKLGIVSRNHLCMLQRNKRAHLSTECYNLLPMNLQHIGHRPMSLHKQKAEGY